MSARDDYPADRLRVRGDDTWERMCDEIDQLRATQNVDREEIIGRLVIEIGRWQAKCDEVGVPHDPDVLVMHHRNNGKMIGAMEMAGDILELAHLRRLAVAVIKCEALATSYYYSTPAIREAIASLPAVLIEELKSS